MMFRSLYMVIYKHIKPDQVPKYGMRSLTQLGKADANFQFSCLIKRLSRCHSKITN